MGGQWINFPILLTLVVTTIMIGCTTRIQSSAAPETSIDIGIRSATSWIPKYTQDDSLTGITLEFDLPMASIPQKFQARCEGQRPDQSSYLADFQYVTTSRILLYRYPELDTPLIRQAHGTQNEFEVLVDSTRHRISFSVPTGTYLVNVRIMAWPIVALPTWTKDVVIIPGQSAHLRYRIECAPQIRY